MFVQDKMEINSAKSSLQQRCSKRRIPNAANVMSYDEESATKRITRSAAKRMRQEINNKLTAMMKETSDPYSQGYAQIISVYNLVDKKSETPKPADILKGVVDLKFPGCFEDGREDFKFKHEVDFKKLISVLSGFLFYEDIPVNTKFPITKELYDSFKLLQQSVVTAFTQQANNVGALNKYYYLEEEDLCSLPKDFAELVNEANNEKNTVYRISAQNLFNYMKKLSVIEQADLYSLLYTNSNESALNKLEWDSLSVSPQSSSPRSPIYEGGRKKTTKPKATKPKATKPKAAVLTKPKAAKPKATKAKK